MHLARHQLVALLRDHDFQIGHGSTHKSVYPKFPKPGPKRGDTRAAEAIGETHLNQDRSGRRQTHPDY
eukprot:4294515-Pyramimonas_sp.AAC.1